MTLMAHRKWLVASITGGGVLLGILICTVMPSRYTSTTTLMPPQQTQSSAAMLMSQFPGPGSSSLAALAGGNLGLKNPNDIYVGLLESTPVADAIIDRFNLRGVYHARNRTEARKRLAANTHIHSEKTGFIAVTVTDRDQVRVADVANMYTEQLRLLTQRLASAEAIERRVFYETQLKEAKDSLIQAETGFEKLQQSHGLVQLDTQAKAVIEGLAAIRAQITAAEIEVRSQRSFATSLNPDLVMTERHLASLRTEAAELDQRNDASGFFGTGMREIPGVGMEYLRAEHEVKYRQAMFDLLIKQYDAARLDELKEAAIIQVIEPALPPEQRSSPQSVLILLVATGGSFIAGLLVAYLQAVLQSAQTDPTFAQSIRTLKDAALR